MSSKILKRRERLFLGNNFQLSDWNSIKIFYENLESRNINSAAELKTWIENRSELESYLSENFAWRYIKMTCNTADAEVKTSYEYFVENIQPHTALFSDTLNKKALEAFDLYPITEPGFDIMIRSLKKSVEIFRKENIELETQIQIKQTEYQATIGSMMVEINGEKMTMPKAGTFLKNPDRTVRETAWKTIMERRYDDHEKLDVIFNELLELRHKIAQNAGFPNFRDYMFAAMGRFDYTPADCFTFHNAVSEALMPMVNENTNKRKQELNYDSLRPWDMGVNTQNLAALKPFKNGEDLLNKTEDCFKAIDPKLSNYIQIMRDMGHFDVESREGKAPGGYNYPLEEIGVPFIFMNATDSVRDMVTMVHEGGHAIHSFEVRNMPVNAFRNPTMEVAELASMSMELISMEHWNAYFSDNKELNRAKKEHLEDIITTLPWIATVDKFQHWIYENPEHTTGERKNKWIEICNEFSDTVCDWSGFESYQQYLWHKQLHIFEVPFYYIEYGMAQLGAISVWKNYKENPEAGLAGYMAALKLGYTKTIGEIYAAAGIKFDFSKAYIQELMDFVKKELDKLV